MFDLFVPLKKYAKPQKIFIDNAVFRLHYRVTVAVLIGLSILVSSRQFFGDPISCIVDTIPKDVMDTYCWIHSTFTLLNRSGEIGKDVVYPGVANQDHEGEEVKYHRYYQWVCFALTLQALLFYVPRYLWKNWESGRLKMLTCELDQPIIKNKIVEDRLEVLVNYMCNNFHGHNSYAFGFYFCELLNLINVILQIFLVDLFLDGEFSTYGIDVLTLSQKEPEERCDPMSTVFPKITKCTFNLYGPSGSIQKFDGLCILPLNVVNEKIYIFLWLWFMFLSFVSMAMVCWRFLLLTFGCLRRRYLQAQCRFVPKKMVDIILKSCQIGDLFILSMMAINMNPVVHEEFIQKLAYTLEEKKPKSGADNHCSA